MMERLRSLPKLYSVGNALILDLHPIHVSSKGWTDSYFKIVVYRGVIAPRRWLVGSNWSNMLRRTLQM